MAYKAVSALSPCPTRHKKTPLHTKSSRHTTFSQRGPRCCKHGVWVGQRHACPPRPSLSTCTGPSFAVPRSVETQPPLGPPSSTPLSLLRASLTLGLFYLMRRRRRRLEHVLVSQQRSQMPMSSACCQYACHHIHQSTRLSRNHGYQAQPLSTLFSHFSDTICFCDTCVARRRLRA